MNKDPIQETHNGIVKPIVWRRPEDEMPDSDETVLVHNIEGDPPVWLGYHDGEEWLEVDGMAIDVLHWAPLPDPPTE